MSKLNKQEMQHQLRQIRGVDADSVTFGVGFSLSLSEAKLKKANKHVFQSVKLCLKT